MQNIGMLTSIWTTIANLFTGLFAIIPQTIYFLFTAAASLMDMLQYVVRKLAGLDIYYVNGVAQEGDIVTNIIEGILGINSNYSILSTVFWAMIIFSVVLLVLATIIQMIKTHYEYDKERSNPFYIIKKALLGLATLAIIPITTIFGMYISEGLLMGLDAITSGASEQSIMNNFEKESVSNFKYSQSGSTKMYASLDFYKLLGWTKSSSFSGVIFNVATYNANRVRLGEFEAVSGQSNSHWENFDVFWTSNEVNTKEILATQIDTAFEYCLRLDDEHVKSITLFGDGVGLITSYTNLSSIYAKDLIKVKAFSKFDVGLVWYYYDLFMFDMFLGYAGVMTGVVLMFNLILGLAGRMFYLLIMFLVYPPITGLFPIDEGRGVKTWRTEFMKSYLSVYGTIVGLNIVLIILPVLRTFKLFNIGMLDAIVTALFTLAGLVVVKKVIAMFSKLIGAEDLQEAGAKMAKDFASTTAKAIKGVMKLADVGIASGKVLGKSNLNVFKGVKTLHSNSKMKKAGVKKSGKFGKISYYTKKDREEFKKEEQEEEARSKLDDFKKENNEQFRLLAEAQLKAKFSEEDLEKAKTEGKYDSMLETEQEAVAAKEFSSVGYGQKKSKRDGKIKKHIGKANVDIGRRALTSLNKKYTKPKIDKMRSEDPEAYRTLLEQEKRELAAQEMQEQRQKRREALKATGGKIGTQIVDITGQALKLVGDISGISGIGDIFKKEGVTDAFKSSAQKFFKAVGDGNTAKSSVLKTTEDKDDDEKEEKAAYRKNVEALAKNLEEQSTNEKINSLVDEFKKYYKRRLGDDAVEEYLKKKSPKYKTAFKKMSASDKELFTKYVQEDEQRAEQFITEKMKEGK